MKFHRVIFRFTFAWIAILAGATSTSAADLEISEFMAACQSGLTDKDGDYSDWIEVHNLRDQAIDLDGWYLTDEPDDLTKWRFPSTEISAGGYLVVFASDKNWADSGAELHTNFEIDAPGGYLALVMPDGVTVADSYGPLFPPQYASNSFGRYQGSTNYLSTPTPRKANTKLFFAPPRYSVASMFFADTLEIALAQDYEGGVIRYTLDGTDPTGSRGTTYSAPIQLDTTTKVIKSAVFENGVRISPIATERYVKLHSSIHDFDSNLPIVLIDTFGKALNETTQTLTLGAIIDIGDDGRAHVLDSPALVTPASLKIRGNSSTQFPKKQYSWELWDLNNDDRAAEVLGLAPEADWVFQGPYTDKTLMRNVLAYQWANALGRWAPRTRFVEAYLNTGGSNISEQDYVGVYLVIERIKRDKQRLDIKKIRQSDENPPEVTGGYIIKKDRFDAGENGFWTEGGQHLGYVEPKEEEIPSKQAGYLKDYLDEFEVALYGEDFADPQVGYAKYIDPLSFIDHHIIVELLRNIDGYRLSTFMFKDREERLNMGPQWDFDLSLGNADYFNGWKPDGWAYSVMGDADYAWWRRLFQDEGFTRQYADRWFELRAGPLKLEKLLADIDAHAALLNEAAERNFVKWPILGKYVWPNAPGWADRNTYQKEVDWMKDWLSQRVEWIDQQFLAPPIFNHESGEVERGFELTMSPPEGVTGTIWYTVDGTDPSDIFFTTTLLAEDAPKRVLVPTADVPDWNTVGFDDSAWTSGIGGVGYERSTGYEDYFDIDVGDAMYGKNGTCYVRIPFELTSEQREQLVKLTLRVRYDDGFVVYLNGKVAAKKNAPSVPKWNSLATASHDDSLAIKFEDFDLTGGLDSLQVGTNVLALQGLNTPVSGTDFLISIVLAADGLDGSRAIAYENPVVIDAPIHIIARVLTDDQAWSAKRDAAFTLSEIQLYINEFMADNKSAIQDPDEPGEFPDWLEIHNASDQTIELGGMYLTDDLSKTKKYRIPDGVSIAGRGFLVFWADEDGSQGPLHTNFKLSKGGEQLGLFDSDTYGNMAIDTLSFGEQRTDVSYGRSRDGEDAWRFFTSISPGEPNTLSGDLNCDRQIDFDDIDPFVAALISREDYESEYPDCEYRNADINRDGGVDFDDIDGFVECLIGGGCP